MLILGNKKHKCYTCSRTRSPTQWWPGPLRLRTHAPEGAKPWRSSEISYSSWFGGHPNYPTVHGCIGSEDCIIVGPTCTHCMNWGTLTLLKEDACNIKVVVAESNLQRSVTLLQETAGDTRKREWWKCTLITHVMAITAHGISKQHLLHGVGKCLRIVCIKLSGVKIRNKTTKIKSPTNFWLYSMPYQ